jgi:transglutaminase-like putative cysteine protease
MLVSVWGLLTALVLAHMPVGQPSLGQAARLSARTALLGAPIMALLFVLFPRLGPLWGLPQDGGPSTGLSNSLRMGSVAELALDDSIALRVRFLGPVPPPQSMYFRGPVLARFDGVEWKPLPPATTRRGMPPPSELRVRGAPVRYEMTLEPSRMAVLPLLEAAAIGPDIEGYRVFGRDDLQWLVDRPIFERLRFEAEAYVAFRHGPTRPSAALADDLDLPQGFNPRTLEWADALRRDPRHANSDARALADAVLDHIRSARFTYTLAPGDYGDDPHAAIDEFWLDRRQGFCEHFAAAFVVVMRAMGVPARVVTGYQGTDPLPLDGFYIVRQNSAHAWAEYWQQGVGWIRADPTAAVAPDRIVRSRNLVPPAGLMAGTLGNISPALLARLRVNWEVVNNRWNQWVLSYSRGQQLELLRELGFKSPQWTDLAMLLIMALIAMAAAGGLWAWWDRRRVDPWVRQMEGVRRCLRTLGLDAPAHDPPRALAQRVHARFGEAGAALVEMLLLIDRQRYGRAAAARPDARLTRRFASAARRLPRPR